MARLTQKSIPKPSVEQALLLDYGIDCNPADVLDHLRDVTRDNNDSQLSNEACVALWKSLHKRGLIKETAASKGQTGRPGLLQKPGLINNLIDFELEGKKEVKRYLKHLRDGPWKLDNWTALRTFGMQGITSWRFLCQLVALSKHCPDFAKALELLKERQEERQDGRVKLQGIPRDDEWTRWDAEAATATFCPDINKCTLGCDIAWRKGRNLSKPKQKEKVLDDISKEIIVSNPARPDGPKTSEKARESQAEKEKQLEADKENARPDEDSASKDPQPPADSQVFPGVRNNHFPAKPTSKPAPPPPDDQPQQHDSEKADEQSGDEDDEKEADDQTNPDGPSQMTVKSTSITHIRTPEKGRRGDELRPEDEEPTLGLPAGFDDEDDDFHLPNNDDDDLQYPDVNGDDDDDEELPLGLSAHDEKYIGVPGGLGAQLAFLAPSARFVLASRLPPQQQQQQQAARPTSVTSPPPHNDDDSTDWTDITDTDTTDTSNLNTTSADDTATADDVDSTSASLQHQLTSTPPPTPPPTTAAPAAMTASESSSSSASKKQRRKPSMPAWTDDSLEHWLELFRSPCSDAVTLDPTPALHDICELDDAQTKNGTRLAGTFACFLNDEDPKRFHMLDITTGDIFGSDEEETADGMGFALKYFPDLELRQHHDTYDTSDDGRTESQLHFAAVAALAASHKTLSGDDTPKLADCPTLWNRIIRAGAAFAAEEKEEVLNWLMEELRTITFVSPTAPQPISFDKLGETTKKMLEMVYKAAAPLDQAEMHKSKLDACIASALLIRRDILQPAPSEATAATPCGQHLKQLEAKAKTAKGPQRGLATRTLTSYKSRIATQSRVRNRLCQILADAVISWQDELVALQTEMANRSKTCVDALRAAADKLSVA